MAKIELQPEEALVLVDFLIRFRDTEALDFEHEAERYALWDVCALLEQNTPELLDPNYKLILEKAREAVASDDRE